MSEKNPAYFAFWADRWLGGTSGWSAEEKGCYISLLVHQFVHGALPDDMGRLARIAGCPTEQVFGKVWNDVLRNKFEAVEGGYANARMAEERGRATDFFLSQRRKGKLGGRPRKPGAKPGGSAVAKPAAKAGAEPAGKPTQTQTQTQTHTPEPKKRARAREVRIEDLTDNVAVIAAATQWMRYRKEAKLKPWTLTTWRQKIAKAEGDPRAFAESVQQSIEQGWQGLFEVRRSGKQDGPGLTQAQQALKDFFDDATS